MFIATKCYYYLVVGLFSQLVGLLEGRKGGREAMAHVELFIARFVSRAKPLPSNIRFVTMKGVVVTVPHELVSGDY